MDELEFSIGISLDLLMILINFSC